MNTPTDTVPDRPLAPCPHLSSDGIACRKTLYRASNGEDWDHAGGHWFASDQTQAKLDRGHYDAGALLAGLPVAVHMPEDCPGPEECLNARLDGLGNGGRP